jgi:hypothetical protein
MAFLFNCLTCSGKALLISFVELTMQRRNKAYQYYVIASLVRVKPSCSTKEELHHDFAEHSCKVFPLRLSFASPVRAEPSGTTKEKSHHDSAKYSTKYSRSACHLLRQFGQSPRVRRRRNHITIPQSILHGLLLLRQFGQSPRDFLLRNDNIAC